MRIFAPNFIIVISAASPQKNSVGFVAKKSVEITRLVKPGWTSKYCCLNLLKPIGSMVLLYMVCHGSHQYIPLMLAYIPAPWIRHGYIIKKLKSNKILLNPTIGCRPPPWPNARPHKLPLFDGRDVQMARVTEWSISKKRKTTNIFEPLEIGASWDLQ